MFVRSCIQRSFPKQASPAVRQSRGRLRSSQVRKVMNSCPVTTVTLLQLFPHACRVEITLDFFTPNSPQHASRLSPTGGEPAAPRSASGEVGEGPWGRDAERWDWDAVGWAQLFSSGPLSSSLARAQYAVADCALRVSKYPQSTPHRWIKGSAKAWSASRGDKQRADLSQRYFKSFGNV